MQFRHRLLQRACCVPQVHQLLLEGGGKSCFDILAATRLVCKHAPFELLELSLELVDDREIADRRSASMSA